MSVIPSPVRCNSVSNAGQGFLLNGPVTVLFGGQEARPVADYLCNYLCAQLRLDSTAGTQIDAVHTEGKPRELQLIIVQTQSKGIEHSLAAMI